MIGQIPLHPKEDALSILVLLVTVMLIALYKYITKQ